MDISEILSSLTPEDVEQLKSVAESVLGGTKEPVKDTNNGLNGLFDASMLGNIAKLGNTLSADDDRTALLKALRPLLSPERQQKADEAIKIMKIIQLLPIIRESGLLNGLL